MRSSHYWKILPSGQHQAFCTGTCPSSNNSTKQFQYLWATNLHKFQRLSPDWHRDCAHSFKLCPMRCSIQIEDTLRAAFDRWRTANGYFLWCTSKTKSVILFNNIHFTFSSVSNIVSHVLRFSFPFLKWVEQFVRTYGSLTRQEKKFLRTRPICCGRCACQKSNPQVNCLVDPCDPPESPPCDIPGARCESNYCGGCFAEWFIPGRIPVCRNTLIKI